MDDFPVRIADMLESAATKVRSLTVDRVARITKWIALGMVMAILAFIAFLFIMIGSFRILGELIGVRTAYAVIGGLFALGGVLLWSKRNPRKDGE